MYFSKYLPIEGEIKEGDQFFIIRGHPSGPLRTCYWIKKDQIAWSEEDQSWTDKQDCLYIDPKESKGSGFLYRNEAQKVALFLCSRDIQVGDRAYDPVIAPKDGLVFEGEDKWKNDMGDEVILPYWQSIQKFYKVIGRISPDAKWVTEGMEFTAGDISYAYHHQSTSRPLNDDSWKLIDVVNDEYDKTYSYKKLKHIEIKCPTCLNYH